MKRHFEVLDGLRGTAAFAVVLFHIFEWLFPRYADNPLRHAYLAVDFFFMLSGFVIGYAYDDRWPKMKIGEFLRTRLIRLHPLVLLGVAIGVFGLLVRPVSRRSAKCKYMENASWCSFGNAHASFPGIA